MKYIFILFAFLSITGIASANATSTTNGDPMMVTQPWGLDGYHTEIIASGTVVVDEAGISDVCPKWYLRGCFSLIKTDYYRNQMLNLAKDLLKNYGNLAYKIFPQYSGWYNLVR